MKRDNTITSIFGRKGSGKSTLVGQITSDHRRVFVFDSMGEYDETRGFVVCYGLAECARAMVELRRSPLFRLSLRVDRVEDFLKLLRIAYEIPDTLLVIEETSLYCSPSRLPDDLSRLVRYGRHRKLNIVFVARRPSEIHRELTAQSDVIVTFRQHEPRDVDYLKSFIGPRVENVSRLPEYHVLAFGDREKIPVAVIERLQMQERRGLRAS
jgi:DNA helicase HerA-like ATPase